MKIVYTLLPAAILASCLLLSGCSDDSSPSGPDSGDDNVSFSVTGDFEGSFSGFGEIIFVNTPDLTYWVLDSYDIPDDTYFLTIQTNDEGGIFETGTYTVGAFDEADFYATITYFGNDVFYESNSEFTGQVVISSISSTRAAGTFQFDLGGFNDDSELVTASIRNGQFDARIVEFND
jgi:hypothetical protein